MAAGRLSGGTGGVHCARPVQRDCPAPRRPPRRLRARAEEEPHRAGEAEGVPAERLVISLRLRHCCHGGSDAPRVAAFAKFDLLSALL